MAKKRFDAKLISQTATGQWRGIIVNLGGVDAALLDGSHHPCPLCGGTDRFRAFDDFDQTGGVICNQCHREKNGDGLATLRWLTQQDFPTVLEKVANYLGLKAIDSKDPAKDLDFQPWTSTMASYYCLRKGVSEEALVANGARLADYKSIPVICFPIIGEGLDVDHPVGWVIAPLIAETLPKWGKQGETIGHVKVKITFGSKPGFIGTHGASRLATRGLVDKIWSVEGLSDMLALWDKIPPGARDREIVVTNSSGAQEDPKWRASYLTLADCYIVRDADDAGEAGAENWGQKVAAQIGEDKRVVVVKLPYPVTHDHGKDLRDWFSEGNSYHDLVSLAEKSRVVKVGKTPTGEVDYRKARFPMQELVMKKLQMEVLYEDENGGTRIFSSLNRKSILIPFRHINRLQHEDLVQICGPPAVEYVTQDNPDGTNTFSMNDVRRALSLFSSASRGRNDEKGVGVWQGKTRFGHLSETVVCVNHSSAARWNGDKVLRRIESARAEGLLLDMGGSHEDWFDFDELERFLKEAESKAWREDVIGQLETHLSAWNWRNPDIAPTLVAGLVLATWVQTIFMWRPLVSVTGESNTGKSMLFDFLFGEGETRGVFGNLAYRSDETTAAGIVQKIDNTARILAIDEFEKSQERDKILKMLRSSSRGGKQTQGSSGGKAVERQLRHIVWTAAIESGLHRQPDMNRFIRLGLEPAAAGRHGMLRVPSPSSLVSLGQKLLAIAMRGAIRAKTLAEDLKGVQVPGVDGRVVESFSVPAAMLAVAGDFDLESAKAVLKRLLGVVDREESGQTDQLMLLYEGILSSSIFLGAKDGNLSISQIIQSSSHRVAYHQQLEAAGVKLVGEQLFIAHRRVGRALLKGTEWERQRIDEILLRLPADNAQEPHRTKRRLGGTPTHGILLPACYTPSPEFMDGNGGEL